MEVVRHVRNLLNIATEVVYRSIFIGDDLPAKHVSFVIYTAYASTEILLAREGLCGIVIATIFLLLQSGLQKTHEWLIYSLLLGSLPATWYFITTLPFTLSPHYSGLIALRVLIISAALTSVLQRLNPMELAYIGRRLGIGGSSLYLPLLWKVTPHLMKDVENALTVTALKREKLWKGLAISFLALEEYSGYYEEGLHLKKGLFRPTFWYDWSETALMIALLTASSLTLAFMWFTSMP